MASISSDLKELNLEELKMTKPKTSVDGPNPAAVTNRSLGAIPKVAPNKAKIQTEASGSTESPRAARRRRNKKKEVASSSSANAQQKGKASEPDLSEASNPLKVGDLDCERVPSLNFPELDSLLSGSVNAAAAQADNSLILDEVCSSKDTTSISSVKPATGKKAGSRRRRGGKRKKQKSPEPSKEGASATATVSSENKENLAGAAAAAAAAAGKFELPTCKYSDDSDSDGANGDSGRKFLWRNVTKNGMIKKCVLVDGILEGGRPKSGDTVLVKSQGKLREGTIVDDYPTLVFNVGENEVIEGLDLAVRSMYKNELSIVSVKPEMAYGGLGRKDDIPANSRITYLFGLLHFEKQKEISQLTWAQRRKSGQSRMRLANWWYQRKEYSVAVKCYKRALEYYNNIPTNQECSTPEEYKELLQLMEERLRVMRQVANVFKRIANMIQSGQISA